MDARGRESDRATYCFRPWRPAGLSDFIWGNRARAAMLCGRVNHFNQAVCEAYQVNILVTGGAGYVGSHAVRLLTGAGHSVLVYDNLCQGHRSACPADRLIVGDLSDRAKLTAAMKEHRIEAVMHFAAFALVGESVADPSKYYENNVLGSWSLLEAMRAADVKRFILSSTTATYGAPETIPITEDESQQPINPYGFSKLVVERMLDDYAHAY